MEKILMDRRALFRSGMALGIASSLMRCLSWPLKKPKSPRFGRSQAR